MTKLSRSLAVACAFTGLNVSAANLDLQQVFSKPLILGASVSAGFMTDSPGTRAAERYTDPASVLNFAVFGAYGRDQIKYLTPANLAGRSVVIAIDFMFWDSWATPDTVYARNVEASENALWKLISTTYANHIPLILGDIPIAQIHDDDQPAAMELNLDIHAWCQESNGCYVFGLRDLIAQASSSAGLAINGKVLKMSQITTDGFHLKASASEALADMMVQMLNPEAPLIRRPGPPEKDLGFGDEIKYLLKHGTGKPKDRP